MVEDTRFPPDVQVKKGYTWSEQLAIAMACLTDNGQKGLVEWVVQVCTRYSMTFKGLKLIESLRFLVMFLLKGNVSSKIQTVHPRKSISTMPKNLRTWKFPPLQRDHRPRLWPNSQITVRLHDVFPLDPSLLDALPSDTLHQ